jgi:hypothetical protein
MSTTGGGGFVKGVLSPVGGATGVAGCPARAGCCSPAVAWAGGGFAEEAALLLLSPSPELPLELLELLELSILSGLLALTVLMSLVITAGLSTVGWVADFCKKVCTSSRNMDSIFNGD